MPHVWSDVDFDRDAAGNMREIGGAVLWHHGVHTVDCDVWCHVTGTGFLCYAPIANWRALCDGAEVGYTKGGGVPTGRGLFIEVDRFATSPCCRKVSISGYPALADLLAEAAAANRLQSGRIAEDLVMRAAQAGIIATYCQVFRHPDKASQLRGFDLTIETSPHLRTWEVKYDGKARRRLFVQTHTRNPPPGHAERWQEIA